ncbi:MAG: cell division ATP-binding protein FtsE [Gammaproteobacteria bacterium]|nr:cell division ATP-binding protein FtsE [Gammaproteobacteria bacterium]MDH5727672.1 cell division ATP-binding protein FtsE [Gammaproteobacteria bacterium]
MSEPVIHFDHVRKRYQNGHEALRDVCFSMERGELAFLTGHSGAGKSTLLKLIAMIDRPSGGSIIIENRNLSGISNWQIPYFRRRIGIIFQNPTLLNDRNVFENVALPLLISGYKSEDIRRRVRAALDQVSLLDKEKSTPLALSGGEQQRVGIARAIVNKPAVILADEPTGNLDPELSVDIMNIFRRFNQVGVTTLVATHDVELVREFPYRRLILRDGILSEAPDL